ncbi:MAG: YHYH protein [Limisphaerales bacterium]
MKTITLVLALTGFAPLLPAHEGEHSELHLASLQSGGGANRVSLVVEGDYRMIRANGIPDHSTGSFPNRNNPNRISAQNYTFRVPAKPTVAAQTTSLGMFPFGVALNGVVFDPGAAEWWNRDPRSGWQYEPMHLEGRLGADQNNAHVQPTGAYHYHAIPTGLLNKLSEGKSGMILVGWAADGFPHLWSTRLRKPRESQEYAQEPEIQLPIEEKRATERPRRQT